MNRYLRSVFVISFGAVKMGFTKVFHPKEFSGTVFSMLSPFSEITLNYGGRLKIGRGLKMCDGSKLRVRKSGECHIGKNVFLGSGSRAVCYEKISIGDNCELSPNVQIYDHDHDFRVSGGLAANKYQTAPVVIGQNVWIGANTIVLRGTTIGDNCIIGAGCVLKGNYPSNSVVVQKRITEIRVWENTVQ